MRFAPFFSMCPDLARNEVLGVTLKQAGPIPPGRYLCVELYCDDPECDCRRVMLQVFSEDDQTRPLATVGYGWETAKFYAKWGGPLLTPSDIAEMRGPVLVSNAPQSIYAAFLLEGVRVMLADANAKKLIKKHYKAAKAAQREASLTPRPPFALVEPAYDVDEPPLDGVYVFRLGPIETEEGPAVFTYGVTPTGVVGADMNVSIKEALADIAAQTEGLARYCEPALAREGKALGFAPRRLPQEAARFRALTAAVMSLGPGAERLRPDVVEALLEGCAVFLRAAPFQWWPDSVPLSVRVTAPKRREYEASLLGYGEEQFGLALYEKRGAIERITRLADEGLNHLAVRHADGISVTFDDEPAWARDAVGDAYGVACLPWPMRLRNGKNKAVNAYETLVLAAALKACAQLAPDRLEGRAAAGEGPDAVLVEVTAPPVPS